MKNTPPPALVRRLRAGPVRTWLKGLSVAARQRLSAHDRHALALQIAYFLHNSPAEEEAAP